MGAGGEGGKLRAAARAWYHARRGLSDNAMPATMTQELSEQFAAMGAQFAANASSAEEVIEVWSTNWTTVQAFLDLSTQWRFNEFDGRIWMSLDYSAADIVLRRNRYETVEFADLQLMERAAIAAFEGRVE